MTPRQIDVSGMAEAHKRYLEASLKKHGYMSIIDYDMTKDTLIIFNKAIEENTHLRREFLWIFMQ